MRRSFPLAAILVLAAGSALAQGSSTYPPTTSPPGEVQRAPGMGPGMMGQGQGMGPGGMMMNMDADKSGAISREEFLAAHQQGDARFARIDSDKDGSISRDEWMAGSTQANRAERFRALDTNGDGRITHTELDARRISRFDAMDSDKDGQLTAQEMHSGRQSMGRGPAWQ